MKKTLLLLLLLTFPIPALAETGEDDEDFLFDDNCFFENECKEINYNDPLEPFNRVMFAFNDSAYRNVLDPVSDAYIYITPQFFRTGVSNFTHNLGAPVRFVSEALQGDVTGAATEFGEFMINTIFGLGLFNIADENDNREDLGQSLAVLGFGDGCYIVWPLLGPSNLRDSIGTLAGSYISPVSYIGATEKIGLQSLEVANDHARKIDPYYALTEAAFDPYVAVRSAYREHRKNRIKNR
ncbi:VacJ family lipoprotein [Patescibacteria group bacterium]